MKNIQITNSKNHLYLNAKAELLNDDDFCTDEFGNRSFEQKYNFIETIEEKPVEQKSFRIRIKSQLVNKSKIDNNLYQRLTQKPQQKNHNQNVTQLIMKGTDISDESKMIKQFDFIESSDFPIIHKQNRNAKLQLNNQEFLKTQRKNNFFNQNEIDKQNLMNVTCIVSNTTQKKYNTIIQNQLKEFEQTYCHLFQKKNKLNHLYLENQKKIFDDDKFLKQYQIPSKNFKPLNNNMKVKYQHSLEKMKLKKQFLEAKFKQKIFEYKQNDPIF